MLQVYEKLITNSQGNDFPLSPSEEVTPIRLTHWKNSRMALAACLKEANPCKEDVLHSDLVIDHHHKLKAFPDFIVSLSHTRGAAAAMLTRQTKAMLGVGIDIEEQTRTIKEGVIEKYAHPQDSGLDPLHLWCAKEAAFKASSFFWNREKTFILKDIKVIDHSFWVDDLLSGEVIHHYEEGYLITKAFVLSLN